MLNASKKNEKNYCEDLNFDVNKIKTLSTESFLSEINRLSNLLIDENTNLALTVKFKILNFLKIIHFRLTQK